MIGILTVEPAGIKLLTAGSSFATDQEVTRFPTEKCAFFHHSGKPLDSRCITAILGGKATGSPPAGRDEQRLGNSKNVSRLTAVVYEKKTKSTTFY